jgi:hypothetical protein
VPGDAASLITTLRDALDMKESAWAQLSQTAYCRYETDYTESRNYAQLIEVYERVIATAHEAQMRGVLRRPSIEQEKAREASGD